jgi:soluble lytic murein transglycosylase-like protein
MSAADVVTRVDQIQAMLASLSGVAPAASPSSASPTAFASAMQTASAATAPGATTGTSTPGAATPYAAEIDAAAQRNGIDPALLRGLIRQESNFDPSARSGAGATGLTQLMPATAAGLGVKDATDPAQAIEGGAKYLKQQLDAFGGDVAKALAAYNAGPNAVRKYGGVPPYAETQAYVQKVMGYAQGYRAEGASTAATTAAAPAASTASAGLAASPLLLGALQSATPAASTGMNYSTV